MKAPKKKQCPKHGIPYKEDIYTGELFCQTCSLQASMKSLGKRDGLPTLPFKGRHKISSLDVHY